jgi:predicted PurR-regulated permease PerM
MASADSKMDDPQTNPSPRWSSTAKLVVALLCAVIIIFLLFRFKGYLAPLLLSFLLAYLFHPLASFLNRRFKIPWRVGSTLIFLFLFLIVMGLLTWGGISIVAQVQNLVGYLQKLLVDFPQFIKTLSSKPVVFGPFTLNLARIDLNSLWTQFQGVVQPVLTKLGNLIGSIASGAASTVVSIVFILLIAYFIMVESGGVRADLIKVSIPKHQDDLRRMGEQLSKIWNAFLRGQLIVFTITVAIYTVILGILGVRYFYLLALLAGFARFVPYVGPFIAWTTFALVSIFQTNYFGLLPLPFALIVMVLAWITDFSMDNFVIPRIMSNALKVHPAAVLVTVVISASLFGFIGVLLSAPLLASLKLIFTYILRKMMDLDPWEGLETLPHPLTVPQTFKKIWDKFARIVSKKKNLNAKLTKIN